MMHLEVRAELGCVFDSPGLKGWIWEHLRYRQYSHISGLRLESKDISWKLKANP